MYLPRRDGFYWRGGELYNRGLGAASPAASASMAEACKLV